MLGNLTTLPDRSWCVIMMNKLDTTTTVTRDSTVSIVTCYGLDGPGIESWWRPIFRARPDRLWGPPSLLYNGYWVFPGGKVAGAWR